MFKKLLPWYLLALVVLSLAFIYGCGAAPTSGGGGGSLSNRVGTYSYAGTQSPGDVWSWTISTETFTGSCESGLQSGFWVTGEWNILASGFSKAHVINSSDDGAKGSYAYFLEFPNTMLLVKPLSEGGNNDKVIICAASTTLEPATGRYNFVNIPKRNWDTSASALGTVEVTNPGGPGGDWDFNVVNFLITGEPCSSSIESDYTYSNGTFSKDGSPLKIFMTPSFVFLGDNGPDQGGFGGASLEAISTSELSSIINHTFIGVRFLYYPLTGTGETEPVKLVKKAGTDTVRGGGLNVETGDNLPNTGYVEITFEAQQANGFIKANVASYNQYSVYLGYQMFQGIISRIGPADNKKYMLFGIGYEYDSDRAFNFLAIQND